MNMTPNAAAPVGFLAATLYFLLFLFFAANGSYGGQFFFWTGTVGAPVAGGMAAWLVRLRFRPLAVLGVMLGLVVAMPAFSFLFFALLLRWA